MVTNRKGTYERVGKRALPQLIWGSVTISIAVVLIIFFRGISQSAPYRQTIVVYGAPTHIISWSGDKKNVIILDIPDDVVVTAVNGFGKYAVESLYTLDELNHREGKLFVGSLTNTFGVPINWYIAPTDASAKGQGSVTLLRRIFSWPSIWEMLIRRVKGSVPILTWIPLVATAQSMSADGVKVVDVQNAYVPTVLPDGSTVSQVDPSRLDYLLGNAFLDEGLRSEGLSIAAYNTTDIPGVGQQAARILTSLGLQLVFVGNSTQQRKNCMLYGATAPRQSKTAAFVRSYFHCADGSGTGPENTAAADLVIMLGTEYAQQFAVEK